MYAFGEDINSFSSLEFSSLGLMIMEDSTGTRGRYERGICRFPAGYGEGYFVSPFTRSMVRPPRAWASPNMKRGESDFGQLQDLKSEFRWKSFDT